tara:strand:- start:958 stop:1602 length:645 start_codon:yes stop_codon:yes gene_type:complete
MDEDLSIINTNTRNEKIKNFFIQNQKKFIILIVLLVISLIVFFSFKEYSKREKVNISNLYYSTIIEFNENSSKQSADILESIVNKKDPTYSPLSLYFIIDNNLIKDQEKVNELFDEVINKTPLKNEIKNLIIYKKALYNSDSIKENQLLEILNPIINSNSVWKSHSLYLLAEYFYSKNEKKKSKEFFEKLINLENGNLDLKIEAQKRLSRDLSE